MKQLDYTRYHKLEYFNKEQEHLFSKLWIYGAAVPEFDQTQSSYVLINSPIGEVIITKENDQFNAFYNKCLHRGHPIVSQPYGPLKLICPYHCWSYKSNGSVKNIPFAEKMYGLNQSEITQMSLKKLSIKQLGDFLFINADDFPIDIDEQFGEEVLSNLNKTKGMLNKTFTSLSIELNFNWKLIFENLRDCIHPLYLHPTSLTQEIDFFATFKEPDINNQLITKLTELSSFSRDGENKLPPEKYKSEFLCCDDGKSYLNWLLFPYTHIPSPDGGTLFSVENYVPIAPNKTRVDLRFFITHATGKTPSLAVFYEWFEKAKVVLKEDFVAVEGLQKQMESGQDMQNLGDYEQQNVRINEFLDREVYAK